MADDTLIEYLKLFNGIQDPIEDLNLTSEAAYTTLLNWILTNTREWINSYTSQSYTEATTPAGLNQIIIDIASNIIKEMSLRKDLPIRDSENTNLYDLIDIVITDDIEKRLKPYIRKARVNMFILGQQDVYVDDEDDIDDVE